MTRHPTAPAAAPRRASRVATATTAAVSPAPAGRDPLDAVEREFVTLFGDLCVALGLPRSYGQIYGLAYASPEPICFDTVVARLGLSKGSASQGLRVLRELGALHSVNATAAAEAESEPSAFGVQPSAFSSTRREYLVPETSLRALAGALLRQRLQPPLDSGSARLAQLRALFESAAAAAAPTASDDRRDAAARRTHLRRRLESLESWHGKARAFAPLLLKLSG